MTKQNKVTLLFDGEGKEDRVLSIRELSENAFHWLRGTCCDVRWHGHCFSGIIAEVGYKVVLH